ncbi:hypothetical protein FMEXI_1845 [Fusarium mexicanum]|uniref:Uncharacterized protein n=1 Tax=Fusarium mexicanum TaxID=751941 RepID=A0A8H5JHD3_9HYPO|nr:hypothetical protein FMEXI_1845 [Fusarium mexicanum]
MSGYTTNNMSPGDETQNQTGNQDQYNYIQGTQWGSNWANAGSIEPDQPYFEQNADPIPWSQQPPIPPTQQEDFTQTPDIPEVSRGILKRIFDQIYSTPQAQAEGWRRVLRRLLGLEREQGELAMGSFNNDSSLDASNLFSSRNPGAAGLDPNNTGNGVDLGVGPAPFQIQHEPHLIAGHPNVVNAPPALRNFQPSFSGPSTGGSKKRVRAASPNATAPAPKRMRNLPPNASRDEGDNANSSGIPGSNPNTASTPSVQPQTTRKRKADIDEEEHDSEDDYLSDLRPQKKSRGEPAASKKIGNSRRKEDNERVVEGTICDFCSQHPQIHAANPCDWEQVPNSNGPEMYNLECTNCADYRSQNKDNTELAERGGHKCQVPGPVTPLIHFEQKSPGPLYYLALGYGSGGVNDFKDGRRLEHWIGPAAPVYGLIDPKDGPRRYQDVARVHRNHRPPAGVAPPGIPHNVSLSNMTAEGLRNLITGHWPHDCQVPRANLEGYKKVWALLRKDQDVRMSMLNMSPNASKRVATARSFQGGPVLEDIRKIQKAMLPSAHGNPNGTQSQGSSQPLTTQLPMEYGNGDFTELLNGSDEHPAALGQQYGGYDDEQIGQSYALTQPMQPMQSMQPMQPFLGQADQQIYGSSERQDERHIPQDQVAQYQQDWGNTSQQMLEPQDPTVPEQDSQSWDYQNVELLQRATQADANDGSDERQSFANSVILAQGIENGQQEPHSDSQALDQSPEGSNESQDASSEDFWDKYTTLNDKSAHRRSRANQDKRWHKPQTSRGSKRPSRERMARANRAPKNADSQGVFNPFLGFTFGSEQKPQSKKMPKSSRWKIFNHLEGIDMSEWHVSKFQEPECANRMLGPSLCRFHRLYYAEEVLKHAALMQEWRLSRFKKIVCPSCLAQKPSEQVNVSANVDGLVEGAPTAWACVVCGDWVVNGQNGVNNQPKAIDELPRNLNIGRKLLDPRREITTGRVLGEVE